MSVNYSEILTESRYKAYIQKFWILNNISNPFHTPIKYALPNGCCTISFIGGDGLSINFADKLIELSAGIYLSGQITGRVGISLKPFTKAIMAQVKPWFPPMITKIPLNELVDSPLSLEHLNRDLYKSLLGIDLTNEEEIVSAFYKALDVYLHDSGDTHFIQWIYNRLQKGVLTQTNIADMAVASGYSQRRMEQKFKILIGPTAKEMQRILQLR